MITHHIRTRTRIIAACLSLVAGISIAYYVSSTRESIVDFNLQRDKEFVMSLFNKDWYWLSAYKREESRPDLILEYRTPYVQNPALKGKLTIKVLYEGKAQAGFIAYFLETFYVGRILFIDVADQFRGKRLGEKLLNYACKDLFKHGAQIIRLTTRTDNISAQKLYNRSGFKETGRDDTYVYFERLS